jgi:hypothetical protein
MDSDKNISATFVESGGGQVVFEEIVSGSSLSSSTVTTDNAPQSINGDVYLAVVTSKKFKPVSSVSGMGLTWQLVLEQCSGRNNTGISVWLGTGIPSISEPITALLSGEPNSALLTVSRYSGVDIGDAIGSVNSANTNGIGGSCSNGTDSDQYSLTISNLSGGSLVVSAVSIRNKQHDPGIGFTEQFEGSFGSGGDVSGMAVQEMSISSGGNALVSGQISREVDWAVVALELRAGTANSLTLQPTFSGAAITASKSVPETVPTFTRIELPEITSYQRIRNGVLSLQFQKAIHQPVTLWYIKSGQKIAIAQSGNATGARQMAFDVSAIIKENRSPVFLADFSPEWLSGESTIELQLTTFPQFEMNSVTSTIQTNTTIPQAFVLDQNYPNPFNPATTIGFSLPHSAVVTLKVYNSNGQLISTLVNGPLPAGQHQVKWDGTNNSSYQVSSGVYFYVMKSGNFNRVKKMILIR